MSGDRRARIVQAMVELCGERGFGGTTVTALCARAHVSRRGFHGEFDSLEQCFLAVLDDGMRRVGALISSAFEDARPEGEPWESAVAGLRAALASLLRFFDEQPALARVWVLESLAAGEWSMRRRERNTRILTELIVGRRPELARRRGDAPDIAAGVMAAVIGTIQRHLLTEPSEPLVGALGPLMGVVLSPYADTAVLERELASAESDARRLQEASLASPPTRHQASQLPRVVGDPRARRARDCLLYLHAHPGASNRQVAQAVGMAAESQASAVLCRLGRAGLVEKHGGRPGLPNAWSLTRGGEEAALALQGEGGQA